MLQFSIGSNNDPKLFNKVEYLQNELKSLIEANKKVLFTNLEKNDESWSILNWFLNNKKIPCIPLLLHQNRYITKY